MAKHVILEAYTFTPATNTVVVTGKAIRPEQLLLITNVTRGTVLFNFSDASLGATVTRASVAGNETTTIVLTGYSTSAMLATDKLAILVEETYQEVTPAESFFDPVGKERTSQPQALIDTDFEYGTQPTKWESLSLLANRPSAYYDATQPINGSLSGITLNTMSFTTANSQTTVTLVFSATVASLLSVGQPFFVIGSLDPACDGWQLVDTVSTTTVTYKLVGSPTVASPVLDAAKTYVFAGSWYSGAALPLASSGAVAALTTSTMQVYTAQVHGLVVGDHVFITGTSGATGTTCNGPWVVSSIESSSQIRITTNGAGTVLTAGTATLTGLGVTLYPRNPGYVTHRAFDGGVQFTNQIPAHGYQTIRQTRRYFRYQSGKGVQWSTGSILKPALNVDTITAGGTTVGSTITIACKYPHGLAPGSASQIVISGVNEAGYNGTYAVATTPSITSLTVLATQTLASTTATANAVTGSFQVSPGNWYGSKNRLGMFDSQNGFYFEHDGQALYAVKRSSTSQLSGTGAVDVSANPSQINGTTTQFAAQLVPGDYVVIRGTSYLVTQILSNTAMIVSPNYRGATISNVASNLVISKTVDTKYAQSAWNIDRCDGTGASGLNIDLAKMQMFYADYSWYGAGAIRFGFRNNRGEIIYAHRIANNNVNTEAYMRSGNLPARYETSTQAPYTTLVSTLASSAVGGATFTLADGSQFPSSGTVLVSSSAGGSGGANASVEYISYSAKTSTAPWVFTINARNTIGVSTSAQTWTYSATAPISVALHSPSQASTISHWGSSVIMDGRYDDDKSLVFNTGLTSAANWITTATRRPLLSLRIAPSVDNGFTGSTLGAREVVNRMQLVLRQMDGYTSGSAFKIDLILNGLVSAGTWVNVGGSSLAQYVLHTTGNETISGGENVFTFFTNLGGVTQQELQLVRDLGNCILGGGSTAVGVRYPDGPDIITMCATPVTYTYLNSTGNGTFTQTTNVVTFSNTILTQAMVGSTILLGTPASTTGSAGIIQAVQSSTVATVSVSQTLGSQSNWYISNLASVIGRISWTEAQA